MSLDKVMSNEDDDKWPKKLSLIDRSNNTFVAYLLSQYGDRFYKEEFLTGVSARKRETNAAVAKTFSNCVIFTSLLAFINTISGEIKFLGLSVQISNDLAPILALMAASALLGAVHAFIDDLILDGYINEIGNQLGLYNFKMFLLDKMAINLWADALKPTYFGEQSGNGHKAIMFLHGVFILIVLVSMLSYPLTFIGLSVLSVVKNPDAALVAQILTVFSVLISVWALVVLVTFSMKFEFYRADFNEVDNEPTEHFKDRMREELKQSKSDAAPDELNEVQERKIHN